MRETGTSVVPMRLNCFSYGITKTTRLSGFCRMYACPCEWTLGTMMWLPFTRRTRSVMRSPSMRSSTSTTHGPAAFTSARARSVRRSPDAVAITASHSPSMRLALSKRVRVSTVAPFSRAETAFNTVRRESSTRQSE